MTDLQGRLAAVLRPILGTGLAVDNLRELTGGASRSTWAFDAVTDQGHRPLILRIGPPDDLHAGMELEARVQAAAAAAGAPVPAILIAEDSPAALGNPFLVCEEVNGESIVRRIARQLDEAGRERLLHQCARTLAAVHRADATVPGLAREDQLVLWRKRLDAMADTTATFEWAFRWLLVHRPPPSPSVLVHGDYRMGNLIVDGSGGAPVLAAVLDWELVHVGEAYEDLAWFCVRAWRFGAPASRGAGGLGSIGSFLTAYEQASGWDVDRGAFHWWLALATLRWGVICRYQAERHLSGQIRSVELATIGRRVCENEWDLLQLLDGATSRRDEARPPVTEAPQPVSVYGRPTAAELVAAVAEFLDHEVREATREQADSQVNFRARVAANALRIVERELLGPDEPRVRAALESLGATDERTLAAAVRAGDLDGRDKDLTDCLRTLVRHRLAVAHPGYDRG